MICCVKKKKLRLQTSIVTVTWNYNNYLYNRHATMLVCCISNSLGSKPSAEVSFGVRVNDLLWLGHSLESTKRPSINFLSVLECLRLGAMFMLSDTAPHIKKYSTSLLPYWSVCMVERNWRGLKLRYLPTGTTPLVLCDHWSPRR